MKAIINSPRIGWVRANEIADPLVTRELTRLSSENAGLRDQVALIKKVDDKKESSVGHAMRVLSKNEVRFQLRTTVKWEDAARYTLSLAKIFEYVAPNIIDENTSLGIAQNIALKVLRGPHYFTNWPIGKNQTSEIIADLAALELIEPSKKKHQVSDTNPYWTLTKLGKTLLQEFRKVKLEEGLAELPEQGESPILVDK